MAQGKPKFASELSLQKPDFVKEDEIRISEYALANLRGQLS